VLRKLPIAKKVLREQGFLGFMITSLQFIQKRSHKRSLSNSEKIKIQTKARYEEIVAADPARPPKPWPGTDKKSYTFSWLMPPPGKGSGGHMTLFRFIKYLEEAGHTNHIYLHLPGNRGNIDEVHAIMGESFPKLKAKMEWLRDGQKMEPADGIFATSWETAYPVYNDTSNAKRFYFVQDFEPYFYPVGSLSVLAENTYKFGFFGITAGGWLAKKLKDDYRMKTDFFDFASDKNAYKSESSGPRKEIVFYARPYTERRGFEMGIMALDLFHKKHPEYTINFFGYDVSNYDIPFPYNNLDILEHDQINELYNRCAAGLVMSLTNMSLLPLELLTCGTIPVVNDGPNNRLVSDNNFINYCTNDPISLANALSEIVTKKDLPAYAAKAAASVKGTNWEDSGKKFVKIVETQMRNKS
jgi:glycosyltransferase involved in cell wall biosynthesis